MLITDMALAFGGTAPLVTSHRSAKWVLAAAARNLDTPVLLIPDPVPSGSNWRALHWIAIYFPSECRRATRSIPMSCLVVDGNRTCRSGHSAHVQHASTSQSANAGATVTVNSSSHFPSVSCGA